MNDPGTVAVLGAGSTMGLGMARNIARSGIAVHGWNRTAEKARPLEGDGAEIFDTAREAVNAADVVLTMLADADAVIDAIEDVAPSAGSDTLWLQMSDPGRWRLRRSVGPRAHPDPPRPRASVVAAHCSGGRWEVL